MKFWKDVFQIPIKCFTIQVSLGGFDVRDVPEVSRGGHLSSMNGIEDLLVLSKPEFSNALLVVEKVLIRHCKRVS